jgi:lipopolysaccharide export LptBFGC system permease protein LptF
MFASGGMLDVLNPAYVGSALKKNPEAGFLALQLELRRKINRTFIDIKAEMHSRLVFGLGCILMILIGIGLGITKKGGHLLTAFGASCIPAAVLIVCIMMGKNIAKNQAAAAAGMGLLLMWVNLVLLALLAYGIQAIIKNKQRMKSSIDMSLELSYRLCDSFAVLIRLRIIIGCSSISTIYRAREPRHNGGCQKYSFV